MRTVTRYIPKDSSPIEHELGVVYVYTTSNGKPAAIAYRGQGGHKVWHFHFNTLAQRTIKINEFFDSLEEWARTIADRRKADFQPHDFQVGDIVYNTWGYDQTNVEFYEIVRTTEHYVWIKELQQSNRATGDMTGRAVPLAGLYTPSTLGWDGKHRATKGRVCMKYGNASTWEGVPVSFSTYA